MNFIEGCRAQVAGDCWTCI